MRESRATDPPAEATAGRRRLRVAGVAGALLVACVSGWPDAQGPRHHDTARVPGAGEPIGAARCADCHGHQPSSLRHEDCESCHGSGAVHVQDVLAEEWIRFPANEDCLACHGEGASEHLSWASSDHARAGVLCSDCHASHGREPWQLRRVAHGPGTTVPHARPSTALCLGCHPAVASRLNLPSHHPVREGMLGCTDCHAPHEGGTASLGGATARCTSCHQAQQGGWIFEHAPVAEDCGYCHTPHGSSVEFLLIASEPGVCLNCHSLAEMGATHDPEAYVTRCSDCHSAVHGSFDDALLRR